MKKILFIALSLTFAISLSSCSKSLYHQGQFFPKDYLKKHLIEDIPNPGGNLLFVDQNAFASPKVYFDSSVSAKEYSMQVLDYLKTQNYKFIYTVDRIYVYVGLTPEKEAAYLVKEFTHLDECYFRDSYFFIYGNNEETYTNEKGTVFLKDEHIIRIKEESGRLEKEEYSIDFNYDYQIIINDDPCNVTYIGD